MAYCGRTLTSGQHLVVRHLNEPQMPTRTILNYLSQRYTTKGLGKLLLQAFGCNRCARAKAKFADMGPLVTFIVCIPATSRYLRLVEILGSLAFCERMRPLIEAPLG
jgi:hypothetical protein